VQREEVVISTKVYTAKDPDINSTSSTNRKHIRESVKKSLKRLQMDHVDIIYAHLYDDETPLE
jgi:aryl-alcohol dehydrogenase-like predicted oxidoreductase